MLLAFDNILYLSISIAEKATQYKPSHPLSSPYLPFSHCTLLLCTKTVVWALLLETCESNKDRKGEEATVAQWIMHAHTHRRRSKRFNTYKCKSAINEFFQISLYGNVCGRCACCFLQPLPSKRTHAHMHKPIKIPTCCSVLLMTFWLYYYIIAHTHTHSYKECALMFVISK